MSQDREPGGKTAVSLLGQVQRHQESVESCLPALLFSKLLLKACALGKGVSHFLIVKMEAAGAPARDGCLDCDTLTVS